MAPWWWFPCKPKHDGAASLILKFFNKSTFFKVVSISWTIKCLSSTSIRLRFTLFKAVSYTRTWTFKAYDRTPIALPYHWSGQRITNPERQDAHATTFSTEGPNICESSIWTLSPIAIIAPRILRRLPDFWKICGSLDQAVSQRILTLWRSGFNPDTVYVGWNYSKLWLLRFSPVNCHSSKCFTFIRLSSRGR